MNQLAREVYGLLRLIKGALDVAWPWTTCYFPALNPFKKAQRIMKVAPQLLALLTVIALVACTSAPEPASQPAAPAPTAAPPAAAPVEAAPKGTSISVGEGGVEVNTKDGAVKVSQDSASIALPPKK